MLRDAGYGLLLAVQFLTRVPVSVNCPWTPAISRWALRSYPLVGLLLGLVLAVVANLLEPVLPTPMLALLLLSLWVALSGGLHLDGWMDVADALGSNAPLQRRWEIMKDPQVGSFGMLALVFLLAWKGMLLWALLALGAPLALLVAVPALSRFGAVVLLYRAPCARQQGLAWNWRQHLRANDPWLALLPLLLLFLALTGWPVLLVALLVFLFAYGWWMTRNFGGINGDIVGAAIEGGELWLLLIAWSWWSFAMG